MIYIYRPKTNKMKNIRQLLLLVTVLFCSSSVFSQTVDEIIAKHLDAVGWKGKTKSDLPLYTWRALWK
jgi:hypothetical protein